MHLHSFIFNPHTHVQKLSAHCCVPHSPINVPARAATEQIPVLVFFFFFLSLSFFFGEGRQLTLRVLALPTNFPLLPFLLLLQQHREQERQLTTQAYQQVEQLQPSPPPPPEADGDQQDSGEPLSRTCRATPG